MAEVLKQSRNSLSARFASGSEPFILTAMVSLLGGTLWLFRERELLLGHFYRPEILSITHTLTLGWISMLMMGVLVRLSSRAMGISIRSRRWLLVQFLLMLIGYTGMVFHFWVSGWVAMASAAVLIVLAAIVQIVNFTGIFARLRSGDWLHRYVAAALINFLLAAILGVLLGFNKVYDILGGEFFPNIFAHAHLAAVGWISMMIVGFEHRLLPTSRPDSRTASRGPALRFWLLEAGVIGLVLSLLVVSRSTPFFAAMIVAALALHAWRPLWTLVRGKVQDRASLWATLALVFLLAAALSGFLLSLNLPSPNSVLRTRVQFAYGYAGLLGWITLTITAQVYKLFPMFVWEERFRDLWGKEPVPAMRDLYSTTLQTVSNGFLSLGVVGAAAGIVANYLPLITFFHGLVIIGVLAFLTNFFLMARWALLGRAYHPSQEDWERFRMNFPSAARSIAKFPSGLSISPGSEAHSHTYTAEERCNHVADGTQRHSK